ncbi:MAG: hypothetical protein EB115_06950 [Betaproteobacteria bacterium]|nr:hypothetical protein [Betaproteobacteria bacterium]
MFGSKWFNEALKVHSVAGDVVTVSLVPARAQAQRTLYLDPSDGSVLREVGWEDYSALGKTVEWGVATHMGASEMEVLTQGLH